MFTLERPETSPSRERRPDGGSNVQDAQDTWSCSIAPNPPGAILIIEYRGPSGTKLVEVLLDGVPATDHPTVYVASAAPHVMIPGAELDYQFVLTDGRPQFDSVEILWSDVAGRRRTFTTSAREASAAVAPELASA